MILSRVSIERPVFATVVSALLVVLGIAAAWQLPVREYPDIDPPVVSVTTVYAGASAAVIDREVTEIIEEQISGIQGIDNINSASRDEVSEVSIEFALDRDLDAAAADVRDRLGGAVADLYGVAGQLAGGAAQLPVLLPWLQREMVLLSTALLAASVAGLFWLVAAVRIARIEQTEAAALGFTEPRREG